MALLYDSGVRVGEALWREPVGQALSYPAVYDLVLRLRRRTGQVWW